MENRQTDAGPTESAHRAAEYVRMSTEFQKYSIANQQLVNRVYAAANGMEIVRTYEDAGKSGLQLRGRVGLQNLIDDVKSGRADFRTILVYDISRWGRFQDNDESAFYEHTCTRAGIRVRYCAEPFDNDGTPLSALIKIVKRAMAGEYSRELSTKVFFGQARLVQLGFHAGGKPGFGFRRMLVDQSRTPKLQLVKGDRKGLQSDRVILVHGPQHEVDIVRWIYTTFSEGRQSEQEIADRINRQGIETPDGKPWCAWNVHSILKSERYVGNNVWNKRSFKFRKRMICNAQTMWIRRIAATEPIVSRELFDAVQTRFHLRKPRVFSNDELLNLLRRLLQERGDLNQKMIKRAKFLPSVNVYRRRFGSVGNAYQLIGFKLPRGRHVLAPEKLLPCSRTLSEGFRHHFDMG